LPQTLRERFAQAGAEAFATLASGKNWLSLEEVAAYLNTTPDEVRHLVETQHLAAQRDERTRLRFRHLDVELYRYRPASQKMGAVETQVTPSPIPPNHKEFQTWDPRRDLTPG